MQSTTPVEAPAQADFGSVTAIVAAADDHFKKLLRFRAVKRELAELRAEHDRLQQELFGEGAS
jgi:hypothetical protein